MLGGGESAKSDGQAENEIKMVKDGMIVHIDAVEVMDQLAGKELQALDIIGDFTGD
jgi:hypothetical protein